jgi:uncharacterized protein
MFMNESLIQACFEGREDKVRALLAQGADVNHGSTRKTPGAQGAMLSNTPTPLSAAAAKGHGHICQLLIDAGAVVDQCAGPMVATALHVAAENGQIGACKVLLGAGASVDLRDNGGRTALFRAANTGQTEVCRLLLEAKAHVHAKNGSGTTPLQIAAMCFKRETCDLLLSFGADPFSKDNHGMSVLHYAAKGGDTDICAELMRRGANPLLKHKGVTAWGMAARSGRPQAALNIKALHEAKLAARAIDVAMAMAKGARASA